MFSSYSHKIHLIQQCHLAHPWNGSMCYVIQTVYPPTWIPQSTCSASVLCAPSWTRAASTLIEDPARRNWTVSLFTSWCVITGYLLWYSYSHAYFNIYQVCDFLSLFQRYFWFKKKNAIWSETRPFPMDIEYLTRDTIEMIRPKLKLPLNYEDACEASEELDKEFRAKIGSYVYRLAVYDIALCWLIFNVGGCK